MWYKMIWGLSVLAVVLLIGFSMLIIPTQMELKQMREEAKATEKRLQKEGKHDHEHYHADNGTHAGISDLEQGTETTVEPNNPVNINESGNMTETTETVAIGTESEKLRYEDGIYKGLTFFEASAVWGKKYKELDVKSNKIRQKTFELDDIWNTLLDATKSLSMSFLKSIPPDQLEKAKAIALKTEPHKSGEIESFFNEIMNNAETKTLESIKTDAQILQAFIDANREEREQVAQESENLNRKFEKIFSEMPTLLTKKGI